MDYVLVLSPIILALIGHATRVFTRRLRDTQAQVADLTKEIAHVKSELKDFSELSFEAFEQVGVTRQRLAALRKTNNALRTR